MSLHFVYADLSLYIINVSNQVNRERGRGVVGCSVCWVYFMGRHFDKDVIEGN